MTRQADVHIVYLQQFPRFLSRGGVLCFAISPSNEEEKEKVLKDFPVWWIGD